MFCKTDLFTMAGDDDSDDLATTAASLPLAQVMQPKPPTSQLTKEKELVSPPALVYGQARYSAQMYSQFSYIDLDLTDLDLLLTGILLFVSMSKSECPPSVQCLTERLSGSCVGVESFRVSAFWRAPGLVFFGFSGLNAHTGDA